MQARTTANFAFAKKESRMLKGEVRIALAGLILAFGIPVHSLAQSTFGAIVGTVRDATGATVADATVKLENLNESTVREAKTSLDGNYEALNLKPAAYKITVSHSGFH